MNPDILILYIALSILIVLNLTITIILWHLYRRVDVHKANIKLLWKYFGDYIKRGNRDGNNSR